MASSLTIAEQQARAALITRFRMAFREAAWAVIEKAPPELLVSNDRKPYATTGAGKSSQLEFMAESAVDDAANTLSECL